MAFILTSFNSLKAQNKIVYTKTDLDKIKSKNLIKRDSISVVYKYYYSSLSNNIGDTISKNKILSNISKLDSITEQINNDEIKGEFSFINHNLSSPFIPKILLNRLKRREGLKLHDTIFKLFKKTDKSIQSSTNGKILNQSLIDLKNSDVGCIAPNFTLKDIDNNELELSLYRYKKYVLLDFWASWCSPCVEELPFLKSLYKKYSNYDFEIIGITKDEKNDLWKNAIIKNEINIWKHISITENKSTVEKSFFINAIPVKILINKEGIIIGRWRGGGEENKKELTNLLYKIFNE